MLKTNEINELAQRALEHGNPYIARAIKFFEGHTEKYLYADTVMTRKEIDDAYLETARKDIKEGFNQRLVGYYDKWYRYNHADEGRAYDMGVRRATEEKKCTDYMNIIECMA